MRSKLQYIYSMTVFSGVIATAYFMMNNESDARVPFRAIQTPNYRAEASLIDPSVNQLLQMEDVLSQVPQPGIVKREKRRTPSRLRPLR